MRDSNDSIPFWKKAYFASLILGLLVLCSKLSRPADGDESEYFYVASLTSWSKILSDVFLAPDQPIFVYNRWRPFFLEMWPKLLWSLHLPPEGLKILNWFINWCAVLIFSFGITRFLSLGLPMKKEAPWAIACLYWWSAPLMVTMTSPINTLLVGIFLGTSWILITLPSKKPSELYLKLGAAFLFTFLACQSHEVCWILIFWSGLWLLLLKYLKILKPGAPQFWWPWVPLAFYLVFYRSFSPSDYKTALHWGPGYVISFEKFWINASYYILVIFNAVSDPLPRLFGATRQNLDVTPVSPPIPLVLVGLSLYFAFFAKKKKRSAQSAKAEKTWLWASVLMFGTVVVLIAPFFFAHFRLIHYLIWPSAMLYVWFVASQSRGPKFNTLPVILLVVSNVITGSSMVTQSHWLDFNANGTKQFTDWAFARRPELKECSSLKPCCIRWRGRVGGRSEWELNWNSGAPHAPAYFAEGWPGAVCVKTISLD